MRFPAPITPRMAMIGCVLCGLLLVSCNLIERQASLPTMVPTAAVPLSVDPAATPPFELPPTHTRQATLAAEAPATTATTAPDPRPTQESVLATATGNPLPTITAPPTPFPSPVELSPTSTPSATLPPTLPPPTATSPPTPTPEGFPNPPEVIWPAATPHSFPIADRPRHGVAVALGGGEGFYGPAPYTWTYSYNAFVPLPPRSVQHVPMLVGSPDSGLPEFDIIVEMDNRQPNNLWLVFNECEHQYQCNTSPEEAARFYHDEVVDVLYNQGADSDAELIVGGVNAHECGIRWLERFVTSYEAAYGPVPRIGWHFHLYPEMHPTSWPAAGCESNWGFVDALFPDPLTAFALWREHANNALAFVQSYGRPDDEIWFTEMGCLNYGYHQQQRPVCQADGFMESYAASILNWLNTDGRWVTRYAWYTNWDFKDHDVTKLLASVPIDAPWQYSSLGWYFRHIAPAAAVPFPRP